MKKKVSYLFNFNLEKIFQNEEIFIDFISKLKNDTLIIRIDGININYKYLNNTLNIIRKTQPLLKIYILVGNNNYNDKRTELLTKRGWLPYNEISLKDKIFYLNKFNEGKWGSVFEIKKIKQENMIRITNFRYSFYVNNNHKVLHKKRLSKNNGDPIFSNLRSGLVDSLNGRIKIINSGIKKVKDYPIKDDEIRLIAWILTDGGVYYSKRTNIPQFTIYQSKEKGIQKIKNILNSLSFSYKQTVRIRNVDSICGKKLKNKPLPENKFIINKEHNTFLSKYIGKNKRIINKDIYNKFSQRQLIIFIQALLDGDGHVYEHKRSGNAMLYGLKPFLEWVQMLCVQAGIRTSLVCYRVEEKHYRLNLCFNKKGTDIDYSSNKINNVKYNNYAWSLISCSDNYMVRHDGIPYFVSSYCKRSDQKKIIKYCKKYKITLIGNEINKKIDVFCSKNINLNNFDDLKDNKNSNLLSFYKNIMLDI